MTPELVQPNRRILVVDDNEAIHSDLRKLLVGDSTRADALEEDEAILFGETSLTRTVFELDSAFQGQEALAKLEQSIADGRPYALAFVDIRMPPGWDGVETISHLWQACPELQVVICTAYSDYSWEKMVQKLGYSENLIILKKPFDNIEVVQLAHALTRKWQVTRQAQFRVEDLDRMVSQRTTELRAANDQLSLSEERFSRAFLANPMPLALLDGLDERFLDANSRFLKTTGYSREELLGHTPAEMRLSPEGANGGAWTARLREAESLHEQATSFRNRTGEVRDALVSTEMLQLGQGSQRLLILQDITDRVRLEERLRQAQKMEAVGQLAAGIAHHFNNLHTIIQGNLELCQQMGNGPELPELMKEANGASHRAAGLIRELMSFSGQKALWRRSTDLNQVLERHRAKLAQLLGPGVELVTDLGADLPKVMVDPDSLGWMLEHLGSNARDAMPAGGRWTLRTELAPLGTQGPPANAPTRPGRFVRLSAADTGVGMKPEVVQRLFEPFFTTKDVGAGNGLGLAAVHGLVKQQDGWMEVSSQPGEGSTFSLLLPVA